MKAAELEGALLDHWVARAQGVEGIVDMMFMPSTNWEHGGPIIEREGISLLQINEGKWSANSVEWHSLGERDDLHTGPTPLIAAMRAYVVSKFGEEVPG